MTPYRPEGARTVPDFPARVCPGSHRVHLEPNPAGLELCRFKVTAAEPASVSHYVIGLADDLDGVAAAFLRKSGLPAGTPLTLDRLPD